MMKFIIITSTIDIYLFLQFLDCIMITIKINQLVVIRVLHCFLVIGPIRFQLKVCYYFDTILKILTDLSVFSILSITFATELRFTLLLFCFANNINIYKCYSRAERKFKLESG